MIDQYQSLFIGMYRLSDIVMANKLYKNNGIVTCVPTLMQLVSRTLLKKMLTKIKNFITEVQVLGSSKTTSERDNTGDL